MDYKHFTSLRQLAHILDIPLHKLHLGDSKIRSVYSEDGDMERIIKYCELDVITTAQVFLKLRNEELLTEDEFVRI